MQSHLARRVAAHRIRDAVRVLSLVMSGKKNL